MELWLNPFIANAEVIENIKKHAHVSQFLSKCIQKIKKKNISLFICAEIQSH